MSIKLIEPIALLRIALATDEAGFRTETEVPIAHVSAYREDQYGSEVWKNRSLFSKATTLFRIRPIPKVALDNRCVVLCSDGRFNILSVEDIRHRGLYWELLAEKVGTEGVVEDG